MISLEIVSKFLAVVGAIAIIRAIILGALRFHQLFLHRSTFSSYISTDASSPSWALVTGASDGIGKAFATELCSRGANVIIHGRNRSKLQRIKDELLDRYPDRKVEIAIADAAKYDAADAIDSIVQLVSSLPDGGKLRCLVNNVGGANALIGQGIYHRLADTSPDEVDVLVNVNVRFPARLTTALLPSMTDNTLPTLIINVGSMAAVFNLPYMAVYNATKAFNLSFSESLGAELKTEGHNVEVLGLVVGSVDSAGAPAKGQGSPLWLESSVMAKSTLDSVGCGESIYSVQWVHWLTVAVMKLLPRRMLYSVVKGNWEAEKKAS